MSILIVGNDDRQKQLYTLLLREGYDVREYKGDLFDGEAVILPLPLTRDGVTVNTVPELALDGVISALCGRRVFYGKGTPDFDREIRRVAELAFDYNSDERFLYENARITAEAAIAIAIERFPIALFGMKALVVGFGRIAKFLSKYLLAMGADVTVCARRASDLALANAEGYSVYDISGGFCEPLPSAPDVIFNTAPAKIIDRSACELLLGAPAIDLAGGGCMSEYDGEIISALALPARYSPASAALALFNSIKDKLSEV